MDYHEVRMLCFVKINSVFCLFCFLTFYVIDDLRKSSGLHSVNAYRHALYYIYQSMPAGVAQSRHVFVGGTASTWGR